MNRIFVHFLVLLVATSAVSLFAQTPQDVKSVSFAISTTSFRVGGVIPKKFTCDGEDVSPQLSWSGAPKETKSFALIADDPDAPAGTWTHWLIWNIPATTTQLNEAVPKTNEINGHGRQGRNDFRKIGYNGPCPPPGKPHRYFFRLFALDANLDLKPEANRGQFDAALKGHVLAQSELMGRYGR